MVHERHEGGAAVLLSVRGHSPGQPAGVGAEWPTRWLGCPGGSPTGTPCARPTGSGLEPPSVLLANAARENVGELRIGYDGGLGLTIELQLRLDNYKRVLQAVTAPMPWKSSLS